MPISAERETRKPTRGPLAAISGRWLVDPEGSHALFVARTLAGLVKTPGRFRSLSGHLVIDQAYAAGALVIDPSSVDTGNRVDYLRTIVQFACERPDVAAEFVPWLRKYLDNLG